MLWITLLLALIIAAAALGFVVWPLVSRETPMLPVEDSRWVELLTRKDNALRAIKDLEFDHQVGKIGNEDYQRLRERLNRQAIGLIQQLERLTPESSGLDTQLEIEIAKLRRMSPSNRAEDPAIATSVGTIASEPKTTTSDENDGVDSVPVANGGVTAQFCTQCGVKVDPSFKFCANCGTPVVRTDVVGAN